MIAHDARGTPEDARALSPALITRLREAIRSRWGARTGPETEATTDALARTLAEAAAEARDRSLHPEELIVAIKALESEVAGERAGDLTPGERRALRAWLVSACIRAYFTAS